MVGKRLNLERQTQSEGIESGTERCAFRNDQASLSPPKNKDGEAHWNDGICSSPGPCRGRGWDGDVPQLRRRTGPGSTPARGGARARPRASRWWREKAARRESRGDSVPSAAPLLARSALGSPKKVAWWREQWARTGRPPRPISEEVFLLRVTTSCFIFSESPASNSAATKKEK